MSDTERLHRSKPVEVPARRVEVFTGAGRRRSWGTEEKAAIVAESFTEGDTVCGVARRHGLTPSQLFAWRRGARRDLAAGEGLVSPLFVPAVVETPAAPTSQPPTPKPVRKSGNTTGIIEVEIDGVTVRVGRGAEAKTVTAVLRALKVGS
jgi:transposase